MADKAIPKLSHPVDLSKAVDEKLLVERLFVVSGGTN